MSECFPHPAPVRLTNIEDKQAAIPSKSPRKTRPRYLYYEINNAWTKNHFELNFRATSFIRSARVTVRFEIPPFLPKFSDRPISTERSVWPVRQKVRFSGINPRNIPDCERGHKMGGGHKHGLWVRFPFGTLDVTHTRVSQKLWGKTIQFNTKKWSPFTA